MKIHSVKKEDRGTYYCVADNGIGKPAQRNVAVEVEFPPTVEVKIYSSNNAITVSKNRFFWHSNKDFHRLHTYFLQKLIVNWQKLYLEPFLDFFRTFFYAEQ